MINNSATAQEIVATTFVPNLEQLDSNSNGIGNQSAVSFVSTVVIPDGSYFYIGTGCSDLLASSDTDNDGICDVDDPCPQDNPDDQDYDGICDSADVCPFDPMNDFDADGLCHDDDPCPWDDQNDPDQDSICNMTDNCPRDPNPQQLDSDGDGVGDKCQISLCEDIRNHPGGRRRALEKLTSDFPNTCQLATTDRNFSVEEGLRIAVDKIAEAARTQNAQLRQRLYTEVVEFAQQVFDQPMALAISASTPAGRNYESEAQQLITGDLLRIYKLTYNARARAMIDQALANGGGTTAFAPREDILLEVVDKYLLTDSGSEAAALLASIYTDRGDNQGHCFYVNVANNPPQGLDMINFLMKAVTFYAVQYGISPTLAKLNLYNEFLTRLSGYVTADQIRQLEESLAFYVMTLAPPPPPITLRQTLIDSIESHLNSVKSRCIEAHDIWRARLDPNHPATEPIIQCTLQEGDFKLSVNLLEQYGIDNTVVFAKTSTISTIRSAIFRAHKVDLDPNQPGPLPEIDYFRINCDCNAVECREAE